MNASSHDGFVTMLSAFVATVFYGGPLVVAALFSSPWVPDVLDDGDDAGAEVRSVRMLLPMILGDVVEPAEDEEEEEAVPDGADVRVEPVDDAGAPSEEGPTALVDGQTGDVAAGNGTAGTGTGEKTVRPPAGRTSGKARKQKICDNPHPNIHPRDGAVDIDRSLVEKYTKNLESFMSLGYSRPYDEDGVRGWYISGFSCTSPVYKAGLRRGDILLSVNGKNTRSWVGVYLLYQKLKNRDDFDIQVVRKGAPVTLKFRIVPG